MTYHWYIVRNRQSSRTVLTNRAQRKPVVQPDLHQQSACEEISPSTHIIHLHTDCYHSLHSHLYNTLLVDLLLVVHACTTQAAEAPLTTAVCKSLLTSQLTTHCLLLHINQYINFHPYQAVRQLSSTE